MFDIQTFSNRNVLELAVLETKWHKSPTMLLLIMESMK